MRKYLFVIKQTTKMIQWFENSEMWKKILKYDHFIWKKNVKYILEGSDVQINARTVEIKVMLILLFLDIIFESEFFKYLFLTC